MSSKHKGLTRKQRQQLLGVGLSAKTSDGFGGCRESRFRPLRTKWEEWAERNRNAINWRHNRAAQA